ncbi:MAG: hypothetical protein DDT41_01775 [candidate division WS2 bacterium]|nr:hypothetical protein [Candidatus Psychracetigena formicireducens]
MKFVIGVNQEIELEVDEKHQEVLKYVKDFKEDEFNKLGVNAYWKHIEGEKPILALKIIKPDTLTVAELRHKIYDVEVLIQCIYSERQRIERLMKIEGNK